MAKLKSWVQISILAAELLYGSRVSSTTLYIYIPSDVRAKVIQDKVTKTCPSVDISVFSRFQDFSIRLANTPADGIISLPPTIKKSHYSIISSGKHLGNSTDKFVLVSLNRKGSLRATMPLKDSTMPLKPNSAPLKPSSASLKPSSTSLKIGVVDILGRKPMNTYVEKLLGKKVKLKRVTKPANLLPLLSFGSVDAILVPKRYLAILKEDSKLKFITSELDLSQGLTALAMNPDNSLNNKTSRELLINCVLAFDLATKQIMGVETWE